MEKERDAKKLKAREEAEKNEENPTITDESQIVSTVSKVDGNQEPELDIHEVDELLAVKNWAM